MLRANAHLATEMQLQAGWLLLHVTISQPLNMQPISLSDSEVPVLSLSKCMKEVSQLNLNKTTWSSSVSAISQTVGGRAFFAAVSHNL